MTDFRKKRFWYISGLCLAIGFIAIVLVAYFVIQSVRETFYQNAFDDRYEFVSLEEEGEIDPVQVFHGVKLNTFLKGEGETGKEKENVVFEVKDEPVAILKGMNLHSDGKGMGVFVDGIQYKLMVDNETGKESFIIAMKISSEQASSNKFRTYRINENGVIKKSNFTLDTKSKMETQWIRELSGETHGYYTDLPHQQGGAVSLLFLSLLGILFILGGVWVRVKRAKGTGPLAPSVRIS
jgi:hypothetical protein